MNKFYVSISRTLDELKPFVPKPATTARDAPKDNRKLGKIVHNKKGCQLIDFVLKE